MIGRGRPQGGRLPQLALAVAGLLAVHMVTPAPLSADEAAAPSLVEETAAALPPRAVFAGYDRQGNRNLWVTDGTLAGTHKLAVRGANKKGLLFGPPWFTPLGKKLLFTGYDRAGSFGLWVTDGTLAGTREINIVGGGPFTVFGRRALFAGPSSKVFHDSHGNPIPEVGLWITDGTPGGTREIEVAKANREGVDPGPFIVLGGKALFAGRGDEDRGPLTPLWVTDGTSAGTRQLSVPGANLSGIFEFTNNPDFAVLAGKVMFQGYDISQIPRFWTTDGTSAGTRVLKLSREVLNAQYGTGPQMTVIGRKAVFIGHAVTRSGDRYGLWVTNGTVGGTRELAVSGDLAQGLFANGVVPDFTAYRGKVLFAGLDTSARCELWVTDWTSAGTVRLRVPGASRFGLFSGERQCSDPGFTVFRGKVLFNGLDTKDPFEAPQANLWVTDGTAAGTKELTVFSGGFSPSGFAVLGDKVLFSGAGAHGAIGLWSTDATAAGTHEVTVPEAWAGGLLPSEITPLP